MCNTIVIQMNDQCLQFSSFFPASSNAANGNRDAGSNESPRKSRFRRSSCFQINRSINLFCPNAVIRPQCEVSLLIFFNYHRLLVKSCFGNSDLAKLLLSCTSILCHVIFVDVCHGCTAFCFHIFYGFTRCRPNTCRYVTPLLTMCSMRFLQALRRYEFDVFTHYFRCDFLFCWHINKLPLFPNLCVYY